MGEGLEIDGTFEFRQNDSNSLVVDGIIGFIVLLFGGGMIAGGLLSAHWLYAWLVAVPLGLFFVLLGIFGLVTDHMDRRAEPVVLKGTVAPQTEGDRRRGPTVLLTRSG